MSVYKELAAAGSLGEVASQMSSSNRHFSLGGSRSLDSKQQFEMSLSGMYIHLGAEYSRQGHTQLHPFVWPSPLHWGTFGL